MPCPPTDDRRPAAHRWLTALPVYNEAQYVTGVLDRVVRYSPHVLVVDDGSRDDTARLLARRNDIEVVTHPSNQGYGAALKTAFDYAVRHEYHTLITIDCDGQHEPQRIPRFVAACEGVDIVSGSRYLKTFAGDSAPPGERRWINQQVTAELNRRLGLRLTDAFCGFKAYRVACLARWQLVERGYAMPLELWVEAAASRARIIELAVPLIYLDETRSFGGALDDSQTRLKYYHSVLARTIERLQNKGAWPVPGGSCGDGTG